MRHPLVMGNWKLNGSRHMVNELVANLRTELASFVCNIGSEETDTALTYP